MVAVLLNSFVAAVTGSITQSRAVTKLEYDVISFTTDDDAEEFTLPLGKKALDAAKYQR